ncbi:hypothetical protein QEP13_19495 [Enterobacter ludwigii]|uniref:Uncharacterized protein n=1 Tax=Enterobacter cloacae TaxID=550 RepID=A0A4Q2E7I1_ENTCL|nr:hypothetical protein [Enterobacter cloacae]RXW29310.1 hypothetical protein DM877_08925 [Enterobacter cloacae]
MPKASFGVVFFIIFSLVIFGLAPFLFSGYPRIAWLMTLLMLVIFCMGIGYTINGRFNGIFIDYRNRLSLSKLQALCWSILVLSALYTAAIIRIRNNIPSPLDIVLDKYLLAIMGISLTSLAATPAILNIKEDNKSSEFAAQQVSQTLNKPAEDIISSGKIFYFSSAKLASWLDLFRGEESTNAGSADIGKIQQFIITFILLAVYSVMLLQYFNPAIPQVKTEWSWLSHFPLVSESMSWLLGISHAGYLAYKAAPHGDSSSTAPSSTSNTTSSGAG